MIKILFICHGNICRSPMAEFVFRQMAEQAGLAERFDVASAATTMRKSGTAMAIRSIRQWNGCSGHTVWTPVISGPCC